ncbi:MAG: SAM-dependent methyltransferase [Saprospiraceae bacterium]|nr:SAM-dependent methyltransferase [Saprospiraceae bacterium]
MDQHLNRFISLLTESIKNEDLVFLSIKNKQDKTGEINKVKARLIDLRKGPHISFTYSYPTRDVTKNLSPGDAIIHIRDILEKDFYQADLQNKKQIIYFNTQHKSSIKIKNTDIELPVVRSHDTIKKRLIKSKDNIYLRELGIVSEGGHILGSKKSKFRQIDKYVELLDSIIDDSGITENINIADMGSGKAYLTFALYDHLVNNKLLNINMTGIEMRQNLVDQSNALAEKCEFDDLHFQSGTIRDFDTSGTDLLIALHACDTATDDAIYKGIKANAKIIVCSPCCHKQVRKDLNPGNVVAEISRFGILKERLAEMLTDTIRSLLLESFGYKTRVIEFISTEHTPKNLLLVGIRNKVNKVPEPSVLKRINDLKNTFGLRKHYLEDLLISKQEDSVIGHQTDEQ